jgi:predicted O-methyltransferase YrrM
MITTSNKEKHYIEEQARAIGARRLLEIGSFKGQTTAVLSRVAGENGGYVIAIDPMMWASKPSHFFEFVDALLHPFSYEQHFWRNVKREGFDNVRLIKKRSIDPALVADPDPQLQEFDFVFIDGEHLYDAAIFDFRTWGTRVRPGGRVLMHDCISRFPGVRKAVAEIESESRFRVSWPSNGSGSIATVEVLEQKNDAILAAE